MNRLILIGILNVFLLFGHVRSLGKKNWMFELTSVSSKSSNSDLLNVNLNVERIKRGVFALSGEFYVNIDIAEGDGNELELKSFRSPNGDGDFKRIPLEMSRRHFYNALNTHYKSVLMDTFKDCSDLPFFEKEFSAPLEKKTYILDKCQFSQEGMPNFLETGQYKIILSGYGEVEWEVEVLVDVEPNTD